MEETDEAVNRTNVELKFQVNFFKCFKIPPVNRTNVELKLLICCAKLSIA